MDSLTYIAPPVPAPAPLAMPRQDLHAAPDVRLPAPTASVATARLIAFGGGAALTTWGGWQMALALSVETINNLQIVLLAFFILTFGWIAFSAASAIAGVLCRSALRRVPVAADAPLTSVTALVMPVYEEDPAASAAALYAMGKGLIRAGHGPAFEIFILSDSRDADVWVKETAVFKDLRRRLGPTMNVWYRRRWRNVGRKAGNIQEFVERWGGRYESMIVLDADSLMSPSTLVEMARRMQAEPRLGILQSVPALAGGDSFFARLQQFAGRVYGGAVACGVAAWQGDDGNYWGHNAAIRVRAFAACCGLPELPGRKPFGGSILSHDFVEAALMRRAGWIVRMDPDLKCSWEEGPPSLLDGAARDRRWAQGNLQHTKVIGARGLAWTNRAHFIIGIGSYLASPLWLGMIIIGLALSLQVALVQPDYFIANFQLFPAWPRFDSERMQWLFAFAMAVLLTPKVIGVVASIADARVRKGCGGGIRLVASSIVEILVSALFAPIQMAMQTRQVWEILTGKDSGWLPQRRGDGTTPWSRVTRRHGSHTAVGLTIGGTLWLLSPQLLVWLSLPLIGLALAPLLSRLSGSVRAGDLLRRAGLLLIPEETMPWRLDVARRAALPVLQLTADAATLARLVADPRAMLRHFRAIEPPPPAERGRPDADRLTAAAKIAEAATPEEALGWLSRGERAIIAGDRRLFMLMMRGAADRPTAFIHPSLPRRAAGGATRNDPWQP